MLCESTRLGRQPPQEQSNAGAVLCLTPNESGQLALLTYLSALRILQTNGTLSQLYSKDAQFKPDKNEGIDSSDLLPLAVDLHDRFRLFCPPELFGALPEPALIKDLNWHPTWDQLGDARISAHWSDESSLGFVYQFFSTPLRRESQSSLQSANKQLTLRQLITFTQLYTPDWVVDFLLQNTVLPQWSGKTSKGKFDLLLAAAERQRLAEASSLKLIDPACGSGHFLLRAFDLLVELYKMEGWSTNEAVESIFQNNLAGADIDPAALWIAAFSLMLKTLRYGGTEFRVRVNLACAQSDSKASSLLGSLSPHWRQSGDHLLGRKYHAVVTNPPYIGRKLLDRSLKSALKESYRDCHQDLCAAFMRRGLELLLPDGRLGLIGQSSLMYLPSYSSFREHLIDETKLVTIVEAGPGVFPLQGGEKVNSTLFVVQSGKPSDTGQPEAIFLDLQNSTDKSARLKVLVSGSDQPETNCIYRKSQSSFRKHRKSAFNYKCPSFIPAILAECAHLGDFADLRQGLATSDNKRFIRYRWEVPAEELGHRWFPYAKGAGSQRWWAPIDCVVDWQNGGSAIKEAVAESYPYLKGKTAWVVKNEQFYFREGLTFSYVGTRGLAVRRLPPGCIFDVGGSAIFAGQEELDFLLAYLNSSFISATAKLLNPTVNFQVGDLKALPILSFSQAEKDYLAGLARLCCTHKITLLEPTIPADSESTARLASALSSGGRIDQLWLEYADRLALAQSELASLEQQIDDFVIDKVIDSPSPAPVLQPQLRGWIEDQTGLSKRCLIPTISAADFARYVIYALLHKQLPAPYLTPTAAGERLVITNLDKPNATWLEEQIGSPLQAYLADRFVKDILSRYGGKAPVARVNS
jgi:hypothetical protein